MHVDHPVIYGQVVDVIRRHLLDDIDKVTQGHRVVTAAWKAAQRPARHEIWMSVSTDQPDWPPWTTVTQYWPLWYKSWWDRISRTDV